MAVYATGATYYTQPLIFILRFSYGTAGGNKRDRCFAQRTWVELQAYINLYVFRMQVRGDFFLLGCGTPRLPVRYYIGGVDSARFSEDLFAGLENTILRMP